MRRDYMQQLILVLLVLAFPLLAEAQDRSDEYAVAANTRGSSRYTVNKFGRNQDADTTQDSVYEGSDLGGPIRCFTPLSSASNLYIFSDDETDATKQVTVEGLDANYDLASATVTIGADTLAGGTAPVQIGTSTWLRVNRAFAVSTALVGNIYINTDNVDVGGNGVPDNVATTLVTGIVIGENQTLQACYTVPNGYNAFLTQYCGSNIATGANARATFRLRKATNGAASRVQELYEISNGDYACTVHNPPIKFLEKTDIELTTVMSANNGKSSGTFDLVLIKNTLSGL